MRIRRYGKARCGLILNSRGFAGNVLGGFLLAAFLAERLRSQIDLVWRSQIPGTVTRRFADDVAIS